LIVKYKSEKQISIKSEENHSKGEKRKGKSETKTS